MTSEKDAKTSPRLEMEPMCVGSQLKDQKNPEGLTKKAAELPERVSRSTIA